MSDHDEDDKPTVILDLNALKKQKLKQEEDLANIASELEFNVGKDEDQQEPAEGPYQTDGPTSGETLTETFVDDFLEQRKEEFPVILFDFQSDFFQSNMSVLPAGYNYNLISTLPELNQSLKQKSFQIVILNYDVNPKAVNQLSTQIKQKFPFTKTLIIAKAISPEKAKIHAQSPAGANGYYQLPIDAARLEKEILKIKSGVKKVS